VVETDDPVEFQRVSEELKAALREQVDRVRAMVKDAQRVSSALRTDAPESEPREQNPSPKVREITLIVVPRRSA
jgi:hypothetical protein